MYSGAVALTAAQRERDVYRLGAPAALSAGTRVARVARWS